LSGLKSETRIIEGLYYWQLWNSQRILDLFLFFFLLDPVLSTSPDLNLSFSSWAKGLMLAVSGVRGYLGRRAGQVHWRSKTKAQMESTCDPAAFIKFI